MKSGAAMPESRDRLLEGGDRLARQIGQRGIQQGGILALEQADAAEVGRAGDRGVRA